MRFLRILSCLAAALLLAGAASAPAPLLVFAAASLTNVLQDVGRAYEAEGRGRIVFSFAGSMVLARQIEASSGADLFIAADAESMDYVEQRGLVRAPSRTDLLGNTLVLVAAAESSTRLTAAPGFALRETLGIGRLAIANTETVPAGRYARAALTSLRVWDSVSDRLAQGDDVRQTLAFVARGEAPLGVVYATDARVEPRVRIVASFPPDSHPPIVYPAALTREAKPEAAAFLDYLKGPAARGFFERAGFAFTPR